MFRASLGVGKSDRNFHFIHSMATTNVVYKQNTNTTRRLLDAFSLTAVQVPTMIYRAVATLGLLGVRYPPGQISVGKSSKSYTRRQIEKKA